MLARDSRCRVAFTGNHKNNCSNGNVVDHAADALPLHACALFP
ncbi:hypothetical protein ACWEP8_27775 [Streptomyces hydrogenans]